MRAEASFSTQLQDIEIYDNEIRVMYVVKQKMYDYYSVPPGHSCIYSCTDVQ